MSYDTNNSEIATEQLLLNMVLLDNKTLSRMESYKIDHMKFRDPRNQQLFASFQCMRGLGYEKIDILSTVNYLIRAGGDNLEKAGGAAYVASLTNLIHTTANFDKYAETFKENWRKRMLRDDAAQYSEALTQGDTDKAEREHEERKKMIDEEMSVNKNLTPDAFKEEYLSELRERMDKKGHIGIFTGIKKIDEVTGGFKNGELVILAAQSGGGKSAMSTTWIYNMLTEGHKPALFSLEMSRVDVYDRLISIAAGVSAERVSKGTISEEEYKRIKQSSFFAKSFYLTDDSMTFEGIEKKSRELVDFYGADIIFIDYVRQIELPPQGNRPEYELYRELAENFRKMARKLAVPIVALSQLNADGYKKTTYPPDLGQLEGGLAFTKPATFCFIIYNERIVDDKGKAGEEINPIQKRLKLAKSRRTPLFDDPIGFNTELVKFENCEGTQQ